MNQPEISITEVGLVPLARAYGYWLNRYYNEPLLPGEAVPDYQRAEIISEIHRRGFVLTELEEILSVLTLSLHEDK